MKNMVKSTSFSKKLLVSILKKEEEEEDLEFISSLMPQPIGQLDEAWNPSWQPTQSWNLSKKEPEWTYIGWIET